MSLSRTTASPFRLGMLVALVTAVAFLPILGNDWVLHDDGINFLDNLDYRGLGPKEVRWAFTTAHMAVYQPFGWILYEAQYVLFGLNPLGYHFVSLVFQAANAVAFMALTAAILRRCPSISDEAHPRSVQLGAAAAALLFAIHPLRVEVVAWVSAQSYLPSALFAMLATLTYVRRDRATRKGSAALLALCWLLYVAAMLFKPAALALPGALLVLDAFPLRRFSSEAGSRKAEVIKALGEKVPFAGAALFFAGVNFHAKYVLDPDAANEGGLAGQFAGACYAVSFYVAKTAWPTRLAPLYERHAAASNPDQRLVAGFLACAALTFGAVWSVRRLPGWLAAWCAYLALLGPSSNLFRSIVGLVADRYSYVPTMPLFIASAYVLARLLVMPRLRFGFVIGAVAAAAVTLGSLTWLQCLTWRNTEALLVNAAEAGVVSRDSYLDLLADVRERQSRFDEAERCYHEAVRSAPESAAAANHLGAYLARRVNPEAGLPWFKRAVALDPRYVQGYNNIGLVLAQQGRLDDAARQFETAVRIHPYNVEARCNLARTMHRQGRLAEAAENYALVLRGNPTDRRALAGLAELYRRGGLLEHRAGAR
jgi:Tfp pilus assembly protein PilF